MQRATAIPPQVNSYPNARHSQCPRYDGGILHRYGAVRKNVKDI